MVCHQRIPQDVCKVIISGDQHSFSADGGFEDHLVARTPQAKLSEGGHPMAELTQERDGRAADALIDENASQLSRLLQDAPLHA